MLCSGTAWVSDTYKPKLLKDEQFFKDVRTIQSKDNVSPTGSTPRKLGIPRARSAPPRHRQHVGGDGIKSCEEKLNVGGAVASSAGSCIVMEHRPHSAQAQSKSGPTFYTQQTTTRSLEPATFRQNRAQSANRGLANNGRPLSSSGWTSRSRPSSSRPLGRPRSAWGSTQPHNRNVWKPASSVTNTHTSETVKRVDATHHTHPSPAVSEIDINMAASESDEKERDVNFIVDSNRPVSVQSQRSRGRSPCHALGQGYSPSIPDPVQGQGYSPVQSRSSNQGHQGNTNIFDDQPEVRAKSACSSRTNKSSAFNSGAVTPDQERALSPWLDDPRIGLSVGFQADPSLLYFDRHSRCHNHNHLHHPLMLWRPQPACESSLEACGSPDLTTRPNSALGVMGAGSKGSGVGGRFSPAQRYIDSHRPQTAPHTRKELQSFGATSQHRGYLPHYCNFVKTKTLHDRSSSPALITTDDDDDVDDGYITNTEQTPSEKTTSGRRKPRPVITKNKDDATGGKEGGIIRAMSPGSTGYDPSTLFDRLREEGLAGSTSALNTTAHESTLGEEEFDLDPEVTVEGETESGLREVQTQTPVTDVRVQAGSPDQARQPIQIPTTADVTKDQDVTDTERTKTEDDLAAKVDRLTSEGVKDTKSMSRTPIAPPPSATKGKGRRTSCPKKEKVVKERKRKGKKKEQTEEGEKKEDAGQVTQVSEQREDGAETDKAVDITVDVKVPDLPTVGPAGKERTKGKRRKTTKQQISAPKAAAGKKTGIDTSDQKTASFYDFGDLTASTVREETMFKAPVIPSYLNDRMVLSLQSSRFELPMDMKSLEKMTPQEYLRKHCIITTRRRTLYQKIFQKHRDKDGSIHGKHVLCKALKEVLVNTISTDQVDDMCRMLEVNETTSVDIKLFSGVAALAERILYPDFLTEDTADRTEYHKEKVECADFCALEWKLHGLHVNGHVRKILETLG
ncbi:uncharacterized protein LOC101853688 isoform X2 [Aplysia californica]|uniref:Uncharacterized protein LOC101853688 isoform X2 n=1 Tax=Aplysia californica TaxID=6500 RepID=A0ABM0ZX72_APLCA|nr:uncharacterized protein LOC101853688 isoform X2 [Aplysia californica]